MERSMTSDHIPYAARLILLAAICRTPSNAAEQPAFEVVSIKSLGPIAIMIPSGGAPVKSPFMGPTYSPTRFSCRLTLKEMIREAYSIQSWQFEWARLVERGYF